MSHETNRPKASRLRAVCVASIHGIPELLRGFSLCRTVPADGANIFLLWPDRRLTRLGGVNCRIASRWRPFVSATTDRHSSQRSRLRVHTLHSMYAVVLAVVAAFAGRCAAQSSMTEADVRAWFVAEWKKAWEFPQTFRGVIEYDEIGEAEVRRDNDPPQIQTWTTRTMVLMHPSGGWRVHTGLSYGEAPATRMDAASNFRTSWSSAEGRVAIAPEGEWDERVELVSPSDTKGGVLGSVRQLLFESMGHCDPENLDVVDVGATNNSSYVVTAKNNVNTFTYQYVIGTNTGAPHVQSITITDVPDRLKGVVGSKQVFVRHRGPDGGVVRVDELDPKGAKTTSREILSVRHELPDASFSEYVRAPEDGMPDPLRGVWNLPQQMVMSGSRIRVSLAEGEGAPTVAVYSLKRSSRFVYVSWTLVGAIIAFGVVYKLRQRQLTIG